MALQMCTPLEAVWTTLPPQPLPSMVPASAQLVPLPPSPPPDPLSAQLVPPSPPPGPPSTQLVPSPPPPPPPPPVPPSAHLVPLPPPPPTTVPQSTQLVPSPPPPPVPPSAQLVQPPPIPPPPMMPRCPPVPPLAAFHEPNRSEKSSKSAGRLNNCDSKLMEPCLLQYVKIKQQFRANLDRIFSSQARGCIGLSNRKEVAPILQEGPCCGIVALVVAGQMLGVPDVNVHNVLRIAKDRGYSKQGEMFRARDMHLLAEEVYQGRTSRLVRNSGQETTCAILHHLARGLPVLVPYDADRNHEPCMKLGHKAHWTLLTGFLLLVHEDKIFDNGHLTKDASIPNLYHCDNYSLPNISGILQNLDSRAVYVYGVQGKSRYIGIWSMESLLSSNANLCEVDPERLADRDAYILPESLEEELCNQMIFLGENDESDLP